ncbi:MAG: hypothetical protein HY436_00520 [Candidatus Liptonbacteria bacterium]|nr:hypothetical protein [Candidatus Liptonbacteria bacterium]
MIRRVLVKYQDWILGLLAVVLAVSVAGMFVWGIALLTRSVNSAIAPPPAGSGEVRFDFEGFQKLNLGK